MTKIDSDRINIIPEPSWDNVRMLYKKLSDEFHILTDSYNIAVSPQTKTNLDHLIIVIDDVDQCIDELPDRESRDSVTTSLIAFLENEDPKWHHPKASEVMMTQMGILKTIIKTEEIQEEFIDAAQTIFRVTELKRHCMDKKELIDYIQSEGAATARLPLSILKISPTKPFGVFFTRLCRIMGIADMVFDAREDYKKGYTQLKPSLLLYLKLVRITISEGLKLLISFPNKMKFLLYCLKFTVALIKE